MKLFNIMLSRSLGGIQQCFLDYTEALRLAGHDVVEVTSTASQVNSKLSDDHTKLLNLGAWDPISPRQLRAAMHKHHPDAIIAHGNRAIKFALKARATGALDIPVIGVAHNYNLKWLKKCDYIFSITSHLKNYLTAHGTTTRYIFVIPNMVNTKGFEYIPPKPNSSDQIVIGVKARLVKKKGVEILLQALARLKRNGIKFKTLIAGDGPEMHTLKRHVTQMGLKSHVEFLGWVHDKKGFFEQIDILCIPSIHEPFGIVVLEGMLHSKPIICSMSEGPSEILSDEADSLLFPVGANKELSEQLTKLIEDDELRNRISQQAFQTVCAKYDVAVISNLLDTALPKILKDHNIETRGENSKHNA